MSDEAAVAATIVLVMSLIANVFLGVEVSNRAGERDAALVEVASLQAARVSAAMEHHKRVSEARAAGASVEAMDPAMVAQVEKLVTGDVSAMSVADALKTKAIIDKRIKTLQDLNTKYKAALDALSKQ